MKERILVMKVFLLYCDLATISCTSEKINSTLDSFADSYIQVNDSLWFFKYDSSSDFDPLPIHEHLCYDYFNQYVSENSLFFMEELSPNFYSIFPEEVSYFLDRH